MIVKIVSSARNVYYCDKCGKKIEAGSSYMWWKPRGLNTIKWHMEHGNPPLSLLTSSPLKRSVYQSVEDIFEHLDTCKTTLEYIVVTSASEMKFFKSKLRELYDSLRTNGDMLCEIANKYYESSKKIERQYGETGQFKDCVSKGDTIYEWVGYLDMYSDIIDKEVNDSKAVTLNDDYVSRIKQVIVSAKENLETFIL